MGVSLRAYVYHAERAEAGDLKGWRLVAQRTREAMANRTPGWPNPATVPDDGPVRGQGWRGSAGVRRSES
jgi:hypothetical protein